MKGNGEASKTKLNLHCADLSSLGGGLTSLLIVLCFAYGLMLTQNATEAFAGDYQQAATLTPVPADRDSMTGVIDKRAHVHSKLDQQLSFEHISVEQGLSHNSVTAVLQDSTGFMWIGTNEGLNRYDGYDIKVFHHDPDDETSLGHDHILTLYEDSRNTLWIGTNGGGLSAYDRDSGQFTTYPHGAEDPYGLGVEADQVWSIMEGGNGELWVGTGSGLAKFNRETKGFTHYRAADEGRFGQEISPVYAIYEDSSGLIWLGTGRGLLSWDEESERFRRYLPKPQLRTSLENVVQTVVEDTEGLLWVGTGGGGFYRFDPGTRRFNQFLLEPTDVAGYAYNDVRSLHFDARGVLWVGSDGGGLYQFDPETEQLVAHRSDPNISHSLSSNYVGTIYEDRTGVIWIGAWDGGVDILDRSIEKFVHYQNDPGDSNSLSHNRVLALHDDGKGFLWIGTDGGGLNQFNRSTNEWRHFQHDADDPLSLSSNYITDIISDNEGALWVATWGGGINRFDPESENFINYHHESGNPTSLSSDHSYAILVDDEGVFWIGTNGGGIDRFDPVLERVTPYQHNPKDESSLSDNVVLTIYQDRNGAFWVGTMEGGLNRFDRRLGEFTRFLHDPEDPNSLSHQTVTTIHQDRRGLLWIGTNGGGLNRYDDLTGSFRHFTEEDGLADSSVMAILEDNSGMLWISTEGGISRFDPATERFWNYDVSDGLQGYEFTLNAATHSRTGQIVFGGVNGFNAFYPGDIIENPHIPPIVLTSLTQGEQAVDVASALENVQSIPLKWPANYFEFEFVALNYSQSERNQYAYMLEGFDDDWNYIGTRRFGRYTNLPGGTYTLKLKGSNNDGRWNEQGFSSIVVVDPPFWQTNWFRIIVVTALLLFAVIGYRQRVKGVEARSRELETQVVERTHEIDQRRQEMEALYRADEELYRHLQADDVLQALVDIAVDDLHADKSSVFVWDDAHQHLSMHITRGFSPEIRRSVRFRQGEGIIGEVLATGIPAVVEEGAAEYIPQKERSQAMGAVLSEGVRSFMHIPIKVKGEVFGVFNVNYTKPHTFGADEQRLFTALAQRAALAIENAQVHQQSQELAIIEERSRLARDLHDAVTQTLFSASLLAEVLPETWEGDREEGRHLLQELRQLNRGALAEMRTLLLELRPGVLIEADLGDLLKQLAEAVAGRSGLNVIVTVEESRQLPDDVHVTFYRIAQEALNNVIKHAQAKQAAVQLRCKPLGNMNGGEQIRVELTIEDDGRGFSPDEVPYDRLGLGIIQERSLAIGASLSIDSQGGQGTRIAVKWQG